MNAGLLNILFLIRLDICWRCKRGLGKLNLARVVILKRKDCQPEYTRGNDTIFKTNTFHTSGRVKVDDTT